MSLNKQNNINFIIDEDLPIGHLQRFKKKLDADMHHSNTLYKFRGLAAAIAILLVVSLTIIYTFNYSYHHSTKLLLANYSTDIAETEKYYNSVLQNKVLKIRHTNKMNSDLNFDLKEFNETLKNISRDIDVNPHDERLIAALFKVYQSQLDALDYIIEQ